MTVRKELGATTYDEMVAQAPGVRWMPAGGQADSQVDTDYKTNKVVCDAITSDFDGHIAGGLAAPIL